MLRIVNNIKKDLHFLNNNFLKSDTYTKDISNFNNIQVYDSRNS